MVGAQTKEVVSYLLCVFVVLVSSFQYVSFTVDVLYFYSFFAVFFAVIIQLSKANSLVVICLFFLVYLSVVVHSNFVGSVPGRSMVYAQMLLFLFVVFALCIESNAFLNRCFFFFYFLLLLLAISVVAGFFIVGGRQYGWYLDAGISGLLSYLGLMASIYLYAVFKRIGYLVAVVLFSLSLSFVQSRVVLFIFAFALLLLLIYQYKYKLRLGRIILLVGLSFIIGEVLFLKSGAGHEIYNKFDSVTADFKNFNARTQQWQSGFAYIHDAGLKGAGLGSWALIYPRYRTAFSDFGDLIHNDYLQYAIELGLIGLLFLVAPFLICAYLFVKCYLLKESNLVLFFSLLLVGSVHGYIFLNFFFHRFEFFALYAILWVVVIREVKPSLFLKKEFRMSKISYFVCTVAFFLVSFYSSSAKYFELRLASCSETTTVLMLPVCSQKMELIYEAVAPADLPKTSLYVEKINRFNKQAINPNSYLDYSLATSSIKSLLKQAEAKNQQSAEHYSAYAYALNSMMQRGMVVYDSELVEEYIEKALNMDPSAVVAIYTRAALLAHSKGYDSAISYLEGFLSSDWMILGKIQARSESLFALYFELKKLSEAD